MSAYDNTVLDENLEDKNLKTDFLDPYSQDTANPRYPTKYKGYIPLLDAMIEQIMTTDEIHPMLQFFRGIETGGKITDGIPENPYGDPSLVSDTDATGVYQFQPDTRDSVFKRAKQIGVNTEWLEGLSKNPSEWTDDQADIMLLLNMFPRSVRKNERTVLSKEWGYEGMVDKLLDKALLDYDRNAMEELYYTIHHGSQPKLYDKKGYRGIDFDVYDRVNKMNVPEWDLDMNTFLQPFLDELNNLED